MTNAMVQSSVTSTCSKLSLETHISSVVMPLHGDKEPSATGHYDYEDTPCESGLIQNVPQLEPYYASPRARLYCGDATGVLAALDTASIDCIVTSPPYYGQRDYGVVGQLGLEDHPQEYIDKLVAVFREARRVLKPTGSLWVNLGDTYWSGKGRPHGKDAKQKARRFTRPQDKAGQRPLCQPKQLLLIPHRFAIAMQDDMWIVRNDNVWRKPRLDLLT